MSEFGIDLTINYTGEEVEELLELVLGEAEQAVTDSWNDGYKSGVLEYAPEVERLKQLNETLLKETEIEKNRKMPKWTAPLLFCLGTATGILIYKLAN